MRAGNFQSMQRGGSGRVNRPGSARLGRWLATGMLWLLVVSVQTQDRVRPEDDYLAILSGIQRTDTLATQGDTGAGAAYAALLERLRAFQHAYPDWHPEVVRFRLRYLEARVPPIANSAGAAVAPEPGAATPTNAVAAEALALRRQVQWLEQDRAVLQARLREALAARPAASDPAELAKAEQRLRELELEVERLKRAPEPERTGDEPSREQRTPAPGPAPLEANDVLKQAGAALDRGEPTEAVALLTRAEPGLKDRAPYQWLLGRALAAQGLTEPAIDALLKVLVLESQHPDAHRLLAELHLRRQPPDPTLARWYYAQATAFGAARDPALEKRLGLP